MTTATEVLEVRRRLSLSRVLAVLFAALLVLTLIPAASIAQSAEEVGQLPLTGSVSVHDPTVYADDDAYYMSATGGGIYSSPTLNGDWERIGAVPTAEWLGPWPGLGNGLWAPSVERIGDTFYYYYSVSNFGSNTSAIGLKTTQTPGDPDSYVDIGEPVVTSGGADVENNATFNAIDSDIWQDEDGDWWLVWGSHFDGIMIQELDDDMHTRVGEMHHVASRGSDLYPVSTPGCPYPEPNCPNFNRIEGPSVFSHDGWYYLLTAWDWCCRGNGNDNTYKIAVGRSRTIEGPYIDKNGVDLAEGGGTIILNSREAKPGVTPEGLYRTAGAPDVLVEGDTTYLTYHSYRPGNTMGIRPMNWHDGWPFFDEEEGPYDLDDGQAYQLVNQAGSLSDPNSLQNPVPSDRCLTADGDDIVQSTCDDSRAQVWELQDAGEGFWSLRSLADSQSRCVSLADGSGEVGTDVVLQPCGDGGPDRWNLDDAGHGFHRPVAEDANLAFEVSIECASPGSYECADELGQDVVGGVRRDSTHSGGNLTQALKWAPQNWQLVAVEVPDEGHQTITVTVPENTGGGEFMWTIDGDGMVDLGEMSNEGSYLQATGAIDPLTVTDTRTGGPSWSISGQVSDFGDLAANHLGWTPEVIVPGAGAVAGEPVPSGIDGGDGLSVPSTLAHAEDGHELGTGQVGADLDLRFPAGTEPGEYSATLTITALS